MQYILAGIFPLAINKGLSYHKIEQATTINPVMVVYVTLYGRHENLYGVWHQICIHAHKSWVRVLKNFRYNLMIYTSVP